MELGAESLEADAVLGLRLEVAESVVTKGGFDMVDAPVAGDKVVVLFSVEDVEGSDLVSSVTFGLVPADGEPSAATLQQVGGTRGWGRHCMRGGGGGGMTHVHNYLEIFKTKSEGTYSYTKGLQNGNTASIRRCFRSRLDVPFAEKMAL